MSQKRGHTEEDHGTIIETSSLDRDECRPLCIARHDQEKLGKVYANIMTDKSVVIRLNDDQEVLPGNIAFGGQIVMLQPLRLKSQGSNPN